jgi:flagellar basal-body rod protein FlgF
MDNAIYTVLNRQSGLMREFSTVANNIANSGTTGFKAEKGVFSEFIAALEGGESQLGSSLSMGSLRAHATDLSQGGLTQTGSPLDIAINGDGFFQFETTNGVLLGRAGHLMLDLQGQLIDSQGSFILDEGQGRITVPLDASDIKISGEGTLSADGVEIGRIGVVGADSLTLTRQGNNYWQGDQTGALEDVPIASGFLESSNVDPVLQMARMIEVQRHYDAGQSLLDLEDQRIRNVSQTIRQMS